MNRKIITMLIVAALSAMVMSGCGCSKKNNSEPASPSVTVTPTATVTPSATPEEEETAETQPSQEVKEEEKVVTEEETPKTSENVKISNEDATKKIQELVNRVMGEGSLVLPSADGEIKEVEIEGKMRKCYMFGAAKIDLSGGETESSQVKNFYFDADTGEIFEIAEDDSITKVQ